MEHDASPSREPLTLEVSSEWAGQRCDVILGVLLDLSRSQVQRAIDEGRVLIDGEPAKKSTRVEEGTLLTVVPAAPIQGLEDVDSPDLRVLYHDDDVVVIDKPPGIAVHSAPGWDGPTVVGALAARGISLSQLGPAERAGVVHRLDVGTSGVMVLAVSDRAYRSLKDAFHDRTVHKVYHALVQGYPDPSSGTIDAPIGRHPSSSWKFAVVSEGRHAVTHYDTIESFIGATLVEVILETGRTHQIRVHFQAERHPLVGDLLYGADPTFAERLGLHRQWLHAVRLRFRHPGTGRELTVESEYAPDLRRALEILEHSTGVSS